MSDNGNPAALGAQDLEYFVRVVETSLRVTNRSQYFLWAQGALQSVLPHRLLICAFRGPADEFCVETFADHAFSGQQSDGISSSRTSLIARMVDAWRRGDGRPSLVSLGVQGAASAQFGGDLARYGLQNAALHCSIDIRGEPSSQFLFARIPEPLPPRYGYFMQLLVPYMHAALMRTQAVPQQVASTACAPLSILTGREAEILHWVQHGRSNSAIGHQLDISPLTVKNHVQSILKKLDVRNRAEAVAKAVSQKLIPDYGAQTRQ